MELGELSFDLAKLGEGNRPDPGTLYDLIIVGGGPAAMSAAIYAARKMMNLAILTYDFGGQIGVTSEVENYLGFQSIKGPDLVEKFQEQLNEFKVPVQQGEKVVNVDRDQDKFTVTTDGGSTFTAKTVIVATGKRDRPLNVPGEQELVGRGVAYCATCDAPFFRDRKVVVAGGGNSAFTAVQDLLRVTPHVTMVNFASGWQADEVFLRNLAKYETLEKIDNTEIFKIDGDTGVTGVWIRDRESGKERLLESDGIFIEIGLLPNSEPVKGLVETNDNDEVIVDCNSRTNVPGLFGAGDVTTVPYKQIVISAGEGAKAALASYEYLTLQGTL
jgi:NADH-dependent peroxiredoxin subunit F